MLHSDRDPQRSTVPTVARRCDVLIVEDEPVSRRALQSLVAAHGFTARSFPTAEDALRAVAAHGVPNVVLVDFNLPGMNGLEFIRRIEQASATVLPVLITAVSGEVLEEIRQHHPVLCLRKPLDFPRLLTLLSERSIAN
jgi:CheY-like chemotaxis protein